MSIASEPLVSIVTPIYNGERYLSECIDSVLAQTYQNWEYTIVDNCSTDASLAIAKQYAARDSRIRVVENTRFLPAVANHNGALRQISRASKYCKVVFADDWIFPECLQRMVAVAEEHPSVGLVSAYCLEGQQVICTGLPYQTTTVSGRDICRQHLLDRLYIFGSANSVLYRADLVRSRDPFYNEANIHSDTEVCFALLKTSDFCFVHQVLTFTRVRPVSLSKKSADLSTHFAGTSHVLVRHGADFLLEAELTTQMRLHLSDYYQFLAKNLFLGRDKEFWDYHKTQMIKTGLGFSRARLARAALGSLGTAALALPTALRKLRKARSQRRVLSRAAVGKPQPVEERGSKIGESFV